MKKRNIMYIAISVICVVSVILGVYYQIFADKVVDEGAVNTITNVIENTSNVESPEKLLEEFNKCNDAVKSAINVPEYNSHIFRFPGGLVGGKYETIKSQANELLKQNEIMSVDWNALTGDAETNDLSVDFEMQRLKETVNDKKSVVILMHDAPAKKITAESLTQIISYLKEQGYELKNFYDIIK